MHSSSLPPCSCLFWTTSTSHSSFKPNPAASQQPVPHQHSFRHSCFLFCVSQALFAPYHADLLMSFSPQQTEALWKGLALFISVSSTKESEPAHWIFKVNNRWFYSGVGSLKHTFSHFFLISFQHTKRSHHNIKKFLSSPSVLSE